MKLRYIIASLAACLTLAVGCTQEEFGGLEDLKVSNSYVAIPAEGGSQSVVIDAKSAWNIKEDEVPSWLTVSPLNGNVGETSLTITAAASEAYRFGSIKVYVGNTNQYINVQQGISLASSATCAEVIAGPDGKSYKVSGICTSIANTEYGNWYLNDGTGEIYVYGTLTSNGESKKFTTLDIEVGDLVTVEGAKTTYGTTIEFVDATFVSRKKSLVKLLSDAETSVAKEGGEFEVRLIVKGTSLDIQPEADWLTVASTSHILGNKSGVKNDPDTTIVKFIASANVDKARTNTVTFTSSMLDENKKEQSSSVSLLVAQASASAIFDCDFSKDLGGFEINNIDVAAATDNTVWSFAAGYGAKASAGKNKVVSESELISPVIDLKDSRDATLSFEHCLNYGGNKGVEQTLWISTDEGASWSQLLIPYYPAGNNWTFVPSGNISLKPYTGKDVIIKFVYKSSANASATWEIKNLLIVGEPAELTSIAEINDFATSTETEFTATLKDAVVTYINGGNAFIEDGTAGVQLYMSGHGLKAGDVINGTVTGKVKLYTGFSELTSIDVSAATVTSVEAVQPTVLTIAELLENYLRYQNCFVKIEGVTLDPALTTSNRNSTATQGESSIAVYSQVKNSIEIPAGVEGDLICFPTRYNANLQLGVFESKFFTPKAE